MQCGEVLLRGRLLCSLFCRGSVHHALVYISGQGASAHITNSVRQSGSNWMHYDGNAVPCVGYSVHPRGELDTSALQCVMAIYEEQE